MNDRYHKFDPFEGKHTNFDGTCIRLSRSKIQQDRRGGLPVVGFVQKWFTPPKLVVSVLIMVTLGWLVGTTIITIYGQPQLVLHQHTMLSFVFATEPLKADSLRQKGQGSHHWLGPQDMKMDRLKLHGLGKLFPGGWPILRKSLVDTPAIRGRCIAITPPN